jgi:hypothetical protein
MADNPLARLAQVVGGVAMLPGPLGFQALGQLLISGSNAVEVAGANVALAAAYQQPGLAWQVAVGTIVPAVVVEVLSDREARRLEHEEQRLQRLAAELARHPNAAGEFALRQALPGVVVDAMLRNERQRADAQAESVAPRLPVRRAASSKPETAWLDRQLVVRPATKARRKKALRHPKPVRV